MPMEGSAFQPAPMSPDPAALDKAVNTLADAKRPVIITDLAARPPHGWNHAIELAETPGASVWDVNSRLNFPSDHPLNLSLDPDG
jgi:acetolactate synthase-1/2/3 large subunit